MRLRAWAIVALGSLAITAGCNPRFRVAPPLAGFATSSVTTIDPSGKLLLGTSRGTSPGDSGRGLVYRLGAEASMTPGAGTNQVIGATDLHPLSVPREGEAVYRQVIVGNGPAGPFQSEVLWINGEAQPPTNTQTIPLPAGSYAAAVGEVVLNIPRADDPVRFPVLVVNAPAGPLVVAYDGTWFVGPGDSVGLPAGFNPSSDTLEVVDIGPNGLLVANWQKFIPGDDTTPDQYETVAVFAGSLGAGAWQTAFPGYVETTVTSAFGARDGLCLDSDLPAVVTGYGRPASDPTSPFRPLAISLLTGVSPVELPMPPGLPPASGFALTAIVVEDGVIVGGSVDTPDGPRAAWWSIDAAADPIQIQARLVNSGDPLAGADSFIYTALRTLRLSCNGVVGAGSGYDASQPTRRERAWTISAGNLGVAVLPFTAVSPVSGEFEPDVTQFKFTPAERADNYRIELCADADFTGTVYSREQVSLTDDAPNVLVKIDATGIPPGTYFWRVAAYSNDRQPNEPYDSNSFARSAVTYSNALQVTIPEGPVFPALIGPIDGQTVPQPINLDWTDVDGVIYYRLIVEAPEDFCNEFDPETGECISIVTGYTIIDDLEVNISSYQTCYERTEQLRWRVEALLPGNEVRPSGYGYFVPGPYGVANEPFITNPAQDAPLAPTDSFAWTNTDGADRIVIQVIDEDEELAYTATVDGSATSLPLPVGVLVPGPIYTLQVITEAGCSRSFSEGVRFTVEAGCPADYNRDGFLNLDDVAEYTTDFYTLPAIPGGPQPNAPTYGGESPIAIGFGVPCEFAGDAPEPYAADAYRTFGYRVAYSGDGSNSCPFDPSQSFPNLDHIGDYITLYYALFGTNCGPN